MKGMKHTLALILALCLTVSGTVFFSFADEETVNRDEFTQKETESTQNLIENAGGKDDERNNENKEATVEMKTGNGTETETAVKRNTDNGAADFRPDKADYLSYDPLYIAKYANSEYVNAESVDMERYVNIVTAARGVATYNISKQDDFDVTEKNYIAGMNYEIPVYDIDDKSDYYIALPDVNKYDQGFRAYDLMLAYNNDNGENIDGWKYEKGILYIPKKAVDDPSNKESVPEGAKLAVQVNYAIGKDMDFSKRIPVQILSGDEPVNKTVKTENIFDADCLDFDTGIRGYSKEKISLFLNGQLMPVLDGSWDYDSSTGKISLRAMPGVISNINVLFEKKTVKEKAKDAALSVLTAGAPDSYAVSTSGMTNLKDKSGRDVILDFDTDLMFEGWRGHYSSKVIHKVDVSNFNGLSGWRESVKYLYGGKTSMKGADMDDSSNKEIDAGLTPLWAIQSYAVGADVGLATDTGNISSSTGVVHYVKEGKKETHTLYEWLMMNRDSLEKSKEVYADGQGNGIGGANNFAAHWPIQKVNGSKVGLTPSAKKNPDIVFKSDQLSSDEWYAASCSELDDAASTESDSDVYVTCLALTDDYIVLAFAQARSRQNMCAIYKFRIKPRGYVHIRKSNASRTVDYVKEAPNNYSLEGAVYHLYTDAACKERATDINGKDIELKTGKDGLTPVVAVDADKTYYAKEVRASKGFQNDPSVNSGKGVRVTSDNTRKNPAVISSEEPPSAGVPGMLVLKFDQTGKYGWNKLSDASYKVSYYDVLSKDEIKDASPKRSWVFKTRKKESGNVKGSYYAGFDWDKDEPEEGSSDFYIEDGQRVVPCGWFTIQEISAPSGLAIDNTVRYGCVSQPENGARANTNIDGAEKNNELKLQLPVTEVPQAISIVIDKKKASTQKNAADESEKNHSKTRKGRFSSLAGAEYEVYYDDNDLGAAELVGVITTDENGHGSLSKREKGDKRFLGNDLAVGDYIIRETKPSPGFVTDRYILSEGTQEIRDNEDIVVVCDYDDNGKAVSKTISGNYKDGTHTFRTRAENRNTGIFTYTVASSEESTRTYIKKTDAATGKELEGALLQIISLNEEDSGTVVEEWVSGKEEHLIEELPLGKYLLREVTAPYGYDIAEDIEFEIKEDEIVKRIEMKNRPVIISTSASGSGTGSHHGTAEDEEIKDKVKISGLYTGRTYRLTGYLVDRNTGKAVTDANGERLETEKEFTAEDEDEAIELSFRPDPSGISEDTSTVVFEQLYRTSPVHEEAVPVELAKHEDIDDEGQTVHYGNILKTTAVEKASGEHNILAGKKAEIIDIVEYHNLSTEETYTVNGELFDRTDKKLTGIKAKAVFKPEKPDGKIKVKFAFDASRMKSHTLVVFETLSVKGKIIGEHKDPEDRAQTVFVPEIRTRIAEPDGKKVRDSVSYSNLIPGARYVMKGYFVDKKTGKKIRHSDGKKSFVPKSPDGRIKVTLSLAGASSDVVAYEYCYIITKNKGKVITALVGKHADKNDKNQSLRRDIPKTSDSTNILIHIALMLTSSLLLIIMAHYYHLKKKSERCSHGN